MNVAVPLAAKCQTPQPLGGLLSRLFGISLRPVAREDKDATSTHESEAALLGRHFRLLREDMVAELRTEVQLMLRADSKNFNATDLSAAEKKHLGRLTRRTLSSVAPEELEATDRAPAIRFSFAQPPEATRKKVAAYWQRSKRFLAKGSLVMIRDQSNSPPAFALVEERDEATLCLPSRGSVTLTMIDDAGWRQLLPLIKRARLLRLTQVGYCAECRFLPSCLRTSYRSRCSLTKRPCARCKQ